MAVSEGDDPGTRLQPDPDGKATLAWLGVRADSSGAMEVIDGGS